MVDGAEANLVPPISAAMPLQPEGGAGIRCVKEFTFCAFLRYIDYAYFFKVFSLFNVVTFRNDPCSSTTAV